MGSQEIGEIFALVVVIAVLWWKVVPWVRDIVGRQKERIAHQIDEHEKSKAALAEAERKHAEAVNEARVEAAKIRDSARADAQRITEEMQVQAENEVTRIKQRGEEQLRMLRQQVVRELRGELGGSSVDNAGELVRRHLSDPVNQRASVDRFLGELEEMSGQRERVSTPSGTATNGGEA